MDIIDSCKFLNTINRLWEFHQIYNVSAVCDNDEVKFEVKRSRSRRGQNMVKITCSKVDSFRWRHHRHVDRPFTISGNFALCKCQANTL